MGGERPHVRKYFGPCPEHPGKRIRGCGHCESYWRHGRPPSAPNNGVGMAPHVKCGCYAPKYGLALLDWPAPKEMEYEVA